MNTVFPAAVASTFIEHFWGEVSLFSLILLPLYRNFFSKYAALGYSGSVAPASLFGVPLHWDSVGPPRLAPRDGPGCQGQSTWGVTMWHNSHSGTVPPPAGRT